MLVPPQQSSWIADGLVERKRRHVRAAEHTLFNGAKRGDVGTAEIRRKNVGGINWAIVVGVDRGADVDLTFYFSETSQRIGLGSGVSGCAIFGELDGCTCWNVAEVERTVFIADGKLRVVRMQEGFGDLRLHGTVSGQVRRKSSKRLDTRHKRLRLLEQREVLGRPVETDLVHGDHLID